MSKVFSLDQRFISVFSREKAIRCFFYNPRQVYVTIFFRSVGTFARALDCTSTVRQPSLHMSAAAASRDITLVSRI